MFHVKLESLNMTVSATKTRKKVENSLQSFLNSTPHFSELAEEEAPVVQEWVYFNTTNEKCFPKQPKKVKHDRKIAPRD